MWFLNPLFWLGVSAVAAPILVHLVRRTRARKIEFPALAFVRQVPQRTIRRRTFRNILLLILRCLAILLIVLAFTRPFFSRRSAAKDSSGAGATVILIDSSLSMRREQMFANALQRAASIIDEARSDERVALMTFGNRYEVINRFTADKNQVRANVKTLAAGWEGTDYEQALRGAESLLGEVKIGGPKRVVMISDFQASGWNQANSSFKLSSDIQFQTFDVGGSTAPANVAVTGVDAHGVVFGQKYLENLSVQVSNFSDTPRDRLRVDFQINDQTVEKREVSLNARETKVVEFTGFNLSEGANRCVIEIASGDFAHDNKFYFTIRRQAPAKALIVESAARGRSDSFYLQSALNLNDALPFNFTVKTSGAVDPAGVSENALVILNDSGSLSSALSASLKKFVEDGGQLLVATGPHTDANSFNEALRDVLPATFSEAVQTKPSESLAITDIKFDHPIFEVFRESGRLAAAARVFGYLRAQPKPNASVLARYEDGSPALMEANAGKGRVLLFTSSLGPSWNDLPLTPLYLPLVHQMIRYVGSREEGSWHALGQTFRVAKEKDVAPAVDSPDGARLTENRLTQEGDLLVTGRQPGFYRLRYAARPDFAAVNLNPAEGDFTKMDFGAFVSSLTGGAGKAEGREANRGFSNEEIENRQKVWWPLLFVALLLLISESLLARRIKVAKMVS